MSNFKLIEPYIYILEQPDLEDIHEGYEFSGWYFSDETGTLHGPFATIEDTREILKNYIEGFL